MMLPQGEGNETADATRIPQTDVVGKAAGAAASTDARPQRIVALDTPSLRPGMVFDKPFFDMDGGDGR
jgi:hypothetical protein